MFSDALASFLSIAAGPQSMVGAAGASIVIAPGGIAFDLAGVGVGIAPPNIIGNATLFGTDFGPGTRKPLLAVTVGTAFATGNAATWNLALQFAVDGGAPNYQPGAWATAVETGAQPVANAPAGALIFKPTWPPTLPAGLLPRYARLLMQFPAGTNLSAGTIASALIVMDIDENSVKFASKNFTVS